MDVILRKLTNNKNLKKVKQKYMKIIYWLPKILSIGFVIFLSLFSFDVFSEYSGWNVVLPLLIHLIPSFIVLAVALISWKYGLVGAIAFMGFAAFYIFVAGLDRPLSWYLGISLPAAIIGFLFLLSWLQKRKRKES
jgi:predicted neutral ceramidase superfamily lipid hydrolase